MNKEKQRLSFSVIVPAYNEEKIIKSVVEGLKKFFLENNYPNRPYEIIVVNDGSTDKTAEIIKEIPDIKLINHQYNKGYGAAIKNGVKNSKYDWLLFFDADGQHSTEYLPQILKEMSAATDMIIGARSGNYQGPFLRQPGKKFLTWVAEYLTEQKIPDINSGLRIIKKEYFNQFSHLLPNGFSLSTTLTMSFLNAGLNIIYVPVKVNKRTGESTVKQAKHGTETLLLIFRIIMLFNPLKIFFPISLITGTMTLVFLVWNIVIV